jgi:hypothetical protein
MRIGMLEDMDVWRRREVLMRPVHGMFTALIIQGHAVKALRQSIRR